MTNLTELELPQLDVFSPEFLRDPHSHYARALKESWIAGFDGGYMLLDQQSMRDFLADTERVSQPYDNIVEQWDAADRPWGKFQLDHPISLHGEDHKRLRGLVQPAFVPKEADRHRPLMRQRFNALIDTAANTGRCDFAEIACQYPITIICKLLGVPLEDISSIERYLVALVEGASQQVEKLPMLDDAVVKLLEYIRPVIAGRRAGERVDDLLQVMIDAAGGEDRLTDEELHHFVIGLLSGGYDTTMNQLILTVLRMCEFPEEWEKLAADPEGRSKAFIQESLRYKSMFGATARVTAEEFEYRGVTFPAVTLITIPLTFAGQDPAFNEDSRTFNTDRKTCKHIAFGVGPHFCPGKFLALALLEEALPIVVRRMPRPRVVGELEYIGPFGAWGVRTLPIEFDVVASG